MSSAARLIEKSMNASPPLKIVGGRKKIGDLKTGLAGEYLVCADLILSGHEVLRSDQSAPYDLVVDVHSRLVRVQVKTTTVAKRYPQHKHVLGYIWTCRRGKGGRRVYAKSEFDVLALVALDCRRIAYIHQSEAKQIIQIHVSGHIKNPIRSFDSCSFDDAMTVMGGIQEAGL